jgi:hypothetical protein
MHRYFVRRRALTVTALGIAVILAGCEDKRVKQLNLGITRDSAIQVIAQNLKGGTHDIYPNVYTREQFLSNGKNYEVLYFTPNNDKNHPRQRSGPADTAHTDSVPWKRLTPLVFVDNKLAAKGWSSWDSLSKILNVAPKNHK